VTYLTSSVIGHVIGVVTSMEVVPELDDDATEAAALEAAMAMSMGGEALTSPPAAAPVTAASATASLPGD
jgi:hypothetical protein